MMTIFEPLKKQLGMNKMATKKQQVKTEVWPYINKGSHLTVYTYENGSTKLEWDDEALLQDVRAAILKAESTMPVGQEIQNTEQTQSLPKTKRKSKKS